MRRRQNPNPKLVNLSVSLEKPLQHRKPNMSSKQLRTDEVSISWSNIQSQIEQLLYATGKLKRTEEVVSMKMEYPGGYLPSDKLIKITYISKKDPGVTSHRINGDET
jgi:hypothetical protein